MKIKWSHRETSTYRHPFLQRTVEFSVAAMSLVLTHAADWFLYFCYWKPVIHHTIKQYTTKKFNQTNNNDIFSITSTTPQALNIVQGMTATASNRSQRCWGRRPNFPIWARVARCCCQTSGFVHVALGSWLEQGCVFCCHQFVPGLLDVLFVTGWHWWAEQCFPHNLRSLRVTK